MDALSLARDGAERFTSAIGRSVLEAIEASLTKLSPSPAGIRLYGIAALRPFLSASGSVGSVARSVLGDQCRPVRAILFDKTPAMNWSLKWHQDRTIAVAQRREVAGFGPWGVKGGLPHVAPPFEVLAAMVTLRAHLDPVSATNSPLLVAPGSHKLGRIPEADVCRVVRQCGTVACLAGVGDVWLYSTPILHASEAALAPSRRRVLQIDYAPGNLPAGLEWVGI